MKGADYRRFPFGCCINREIRWGAPSRPAKTENAKTRKSENAKGKESWEARQLPKQLRVFALSRFRVLSLRRPPRTRRVSLSKPVPRWRTDHFRVSCCAAVAQLLI